MITTVVMPSRTLFKRYGSSARNDEQIAEAALEISGFQGCPILGCKINYVQWNDCYEVELTIRTAAEQHALDNDDFIISKKEAGMLFRYLSSHGCEWEDSDAWIKLYERLKQCVT